MGLPKSWFSSKKAGLNIGSPKFWLSQVKALPNTGLPFLRLSLLQAHHFIDPLAYGFAWLKAPPQKG
jgi:hypothetical protein